MSQPPRPNEIFDILIGTWTIERKVSDMAKMSGLAIVTKLDPDTADYHEDVKVETAGGEILDGSRDYIFRRTENGFATYFKDSDELFHNMEFSGQCVAQASHLCKADTYQSAYRFDSADRFQVTHKVFGPRKDYEIHTIYSRKTF